MAHGDDRAVHAQPVSAGGADAAAGLAGGKARPVCGALPRARCPGPACAGGRCGRILAERRLEAHGGPRHARNGRSDLPRGRKMGLRRGLFPFCPDAGRCAPALAFGGRPDVLRCAGGLLPAHDEPASKRRPARAAAVFFPCGGRAAHDPSGASPCSPCRDAGQPCDGGLLFRADSGGRAGLRCGAHGPRRPAGVARARAGADGAPAARASRRGPAGCAPDAARAGCRFPAQ